MKTVTRTFKDYAGTSC